MANRLRTLTNQSINDSLKVRKEAKKALRKLSLDSKPITHLLNDDTRFIGRTYCNKPLGTFTIFRKYTDCGDCLAAVRKRKIEHMEIIRRTGL